MWLWSLQHMFKNSLDEWPMDRSLPFSHGSPEANWPEYGSGSLWVIIVMKTNHFIEVKNF